MTKLHRANCKHQIIKVVNELLLTRTALQQCTTLQQVLASSSQQQQPHQGCSVCRHRRHTQSVTSQMRCTWHNVPAFVTQQRGARTVGMHATLCTMVALCLDTIGTTPHSLANGLA